MSGATVTPDTQVTDPAGNPATGTQPIVDDAGPKLLSITWWDLDASGTINDPDTLVFVFSEDMDTSTVSDLSSDLPLSAGDYGTGATLDWGGTQDTLTVNLGSDAAIPVDATVDPDDAVTDLAGNADDTPAPGTRIVQGVIVSIEAPSTVAPGAAFSAQVAITYVTDLDAGDFEVTFDPAVLDLTSWSDGQINGSTIPVVATYLGDGTVKVVVNVSGTAGVTGEGTLAVLNFTFIGNSGEGSAIGLTPGTLSNKNAEAINAQWVSTASVAATALAGDANGDGSLNALDITEIELIVAGDPDHPATPGADANEDGFVNALDITKVELLVAQSTG